MSVNKQSDNPTRRYNSPKRERQASATRGRILAAAERLFAANGYAAVTMEAIAREAGVSLATIYLHFPGRVAMLGALAEEFAATPEYSVEQVERGLTPVEQVREATRITRQLNERAWLIADILRSQRGSDPEIDGLWMLWQQRHLDATRRGMVAIARMGGLRPGVSLDEAADAYYALAGTEVYRALTQERGWSPERYERWLLEAVCRVFLPLDQ